MIKASPEFFRTAGNGSLIFLDTPFVSAFTTRLNGVSSGNFSSFNLYFGRGDKLEDVERNWEILREYLDFNGKIVLPQQIHSSTIKYVPENLEQGGINHIPQCDGLITDKKGVLTGVMFADCLPVLIWGTRYAAILHAGWRGLASGIIGNGVRELISKGENPSELNAALGPCIAAEDYEVGQEVVRAFTDAGLENAVERSGSSYSVLFHIYHINGMFRFESIPTNNKRSVPFVVRKRRERKKLTKDDIPFELKLFFCLLRCKCSDLKSADNGMFRFEAIPTNNEHSVPSVVRERRMRKKLTKDKIPSGLNLFCRLLRSSSLTYRCGYAALLAP